MPFSCSPVRFLQPWRRTVDLLQSDQHRLRILPDPRLREERQTRTTADPVIVPFRDDYYLFSTNQWGYWWSSDLLNWNFVPRKFLKPEHKVYDELCAPAAFVMDDQLYVIGSTYTTDFTLEEFESARRRLDARHRQLSNRCLGPAFLVDQGKLFLYHGSSNVFPLYAQEIDPKSFSPIGRFRELFVLDSAKHGWERFGEAHDNVFLKPFMEGAWMNRRGDRYYMQYSAPGTEFSGYADGVYVGSSPMGPFEYQKHNPFSSKLGDSAAGQDTELPLKTTMAIGGTWRRPLSASRITSNVVSDFGLSTLIRTIRCIAIPLTETIRSPSQHPRIEEVSCKRIALQCILFRPIRRLDVAQLCQTHPSFELARKQLCPELRRR